MLKKILIGVGVLIVLAGAGLYFLYSNLDSLIEAAIEKYGTAAIQAPVTVESVALSPTSGSGAINGVVVGNPPGFTTPDAFRLGIISVAVDIATLTQNPVVIKEIVIAAPQVTYERGSGTGNLETIRDNVQKYAGTGGTTQTAPAEGEPRKVIIENLHVRDGNVTVAASALQGRTLSTGLPAIHLRDIGKDKGGATPAEVAQRVVGAIAEQSARAGLASLNQSLRELGGAAQEQIERAAPGLTDRLRSVVPGAK